MIHTLILNMIRAQTKKLPTPDSTSYFSHCAHHDVTVDTHGPLFLPKNTLSRRRLKLPSPSWKLGPSFKIVIRRHNQPYPLCLGHANSQQPTVPYNTSQEGLLRCPLVSRLSTRSAKIRHLTVQDNASPVMFQSLENMAPLLCVTGGCSTALRSTPLMMGIRSN